MIVLKMIRKIPDGGSYTINLEHPNSQKFIDAVKLIMDEGWIAKFKRGFSIYFNTEMNKIRKVEFPVRSVWADYFEAREAQNKLQAEILSSSNTHKYKFGKYDNYKKIFNQ